jgi:hypothetical protein
MDCLAILPPDMVIHRLTGDGAKKSLLAPLWTGDKKRVLNTIHRTFQGKNLVQGSRWDPAPNQNAIDPQLFCCEPKLV